MRGEEPHLPSDRPAILAAMALRMSHDLQPCTGAGIRRQNNQRGALRSIHVLISYLRRTDLRCIERVLDSAVKLVEEAWHGGEDGGLQSGKVVLDEQHVSSEEAYGCTAEQSHDLRLGHVMQEVGKGGGEVPMMDAEGQEGGQTCTQRSNMCARGR